MGMCLAIAVISTREKETPRGKVPPPEPLQSTSDVSDPLERAARMPILRPDDPEEYANRAAARLMSGKFSGAVSDLTRAIELEPKRAYHYANRADALLRNGDPEAALRDATRACELDPNTIWGYYALGKVRNARGEFAKALENFDRAIELKRTAPGLYLERADARDGLGDRQGAESDRIQAIRLDEERTRKIAAREPGTPLPQANLRESLPANAVGEPVYLEFSRRIEVSISKEGGSWVDQMIDAASLADRALRGLPRIERMNAFVLKQASQRTTIGTQTARQISETGGEFTFLRLRTVGDTRQAVFRIRNGDDFGYQEYLMEASADRTLRIVDICQRGLVGAWNSEEIRRLAIVTMTGRVGLGSLVPNQYFAGTKNIEKMDALWRSGKGEEALKVYSELPPFMRKAKLALVIRLMAARQLGLEDSPAALDALQTAFSADPSVSIVLMVSLTDSRRFAEALAAVDALEKTVGGDAYLEFKRSEILFIAEDYEKAKEAAMRAIRAEKTLAEPYNMMVRISVRKKQFSDAARWLTSLERDAGVQLSDLSKIEEFKEFVASPEYREWAKSR
jgi:tetratricopeptide (TPR) repeat protein